MKKLPSKFQIGDVIGECYSHIKTMSTAEPTMSNVRRTGKVVAVRFTENGEYYDILTDRARIEEGVSVELCVDIAEVKPTEQ